MTNVNQIPVTAPLNGANRFAHIDALRAFAVLVVVMAHAGLGHMVPGGSGVTIFFSISGFIITYLMLRERDRTGGFSTKGFYTRRAIKIAPPLIVVVVIPTLIYSLWQSVDWGAFLAQVFFVFNWFLLDGQTDVLPGSGVVWSLAIEEQFYIGFAMIWFFAVKSRHWRKLVLLAASIAIVGSTVLRLVMAADPSLSGRIYYGSDTRLDGIAWGAMAALAFHWWQSNGSPDLVAKRLLSSDWALLVAVMLYVLSLVVRDDWFRDTFRYTLQSLAACIVILNGLLPEGGHLRKILYVVSQWRPVALIGLASYSIYLVHLVLMDTLAGVVDIGGPIEVVLKAVIGLSAGIVLYKFVEVPADHFGQSIRRRKANRLVLDS